MKPESMVYYPPDSGGGIGEDLTGLSHKVNCKVYSHQLEQKIHISIELEIISQQPRYRRSADLSRPASAELRGRHNRHGPEDPAVRTVVVAEHGSATVVGGGG
jgi:hypothetical protein